LKAEVLTPEASGQLIGTKEWRGCGQSHPLMSARGHERRFREVSGMSERMLEPAK